MRAVLVVVCLLTLATEASAVVFTHETGRWPADWPKELEALRTSAKTIDVGTGIQQHIYEIRFDDRETFEKVWPVLLRIKTPGAPLTLGRVDSDPHKDWGHFLSNKTAAVRIYAPSGGYAIDPTVPAERVREKGAIDDLLDEGHAVHAAPPWPKEIVGKDGSLPEFVQSVMKDGVMTWEAAALDQKRPGFYNRARVDLELVVDGQVIDLNRIPLPESTPIRDRRFPKPDSPK